MGALARLVERCLGLLREGTAGQGSLKRGATILAALVVIVTAVAVSYLRITYQWSR